MTSPRSPHPFRDRLARLRWWLLFGAIPAAVAVAFGSALIAVLFHKGGGEAGLRAATAWGMSFGSLTLLAALVGACVGLSHHERPE